MKNRAPKLFLVVLLALSSAAASARAQGKDEYDMGRMQLVFLYLAPDWKPADEAHAARLRAEHRAFVNGLIESGKLALGGPVEGGGDLREIMVFKEETLAGAAVSVIRER
jgi:hypothetical protein